MNPEVRNQNEKKIPTPFVYGSNQRVNQSFVLDSDSCLLNSTYLRLAGFAKPEKIQLMIDYLITCGLRHLFGPIRNVTKIQFDHIPALLADDMVMVTLQLTKLIFNRRPIGDFKNNSQGLEKIKGSVDRSQPDFFPLFEKVLIHFQRTRRA
jgi:hypothetical protein